MLDLNNPIVYSAAETATINDVMATGNSGPDMWADGRVHDVKHHISVHTLTESSIQDPVKNFITDLLKWEDDFYAVRIEPFVPKKFVEKFKQDAKIRMFSYRSKIGVSQIMRENELLLKGQAFDIEIKITPIEDKFLPGTESVEALAGALAEKQVDGVGLGDFEQQSVYIQDGKEHKAHYDISKEIKSIRPTIYLVDEGVYVDEETGQPDFTQIKDFTLNLLEEVKQESIK